MGHRLTPTYSEAEWRDYLDFHSMSEFALSYSKTCSMSSDSDDATCHPFMHGLPLPLRLRGGGPSTDDLSPNPNEGSESNPRRVTPTDVLVDSDDSSSAPKKRKRPIQQRQPLASCNSGTDDDDDGSGDADGPVSVLRQRRNVDHQNNLDNSDVNIPDEGSDDLTTE